MTGYILLDTPNVNQPQGTHPRRGGAKLSGTCILHTSEGNWRRGVQSLINLVRSRSDWGCYHQGCDWEDIAKFYPWEWETWQDTETNNWAVGIAAACKTSDWAIMPADIREGYYRNMARMAADFVTYMATKGITVPLRRITGTEARARVPGFCAHGDSGVARSDPGAAFEWARFFEYTRQALAGITPQSSQELFTMGQYEEVQRQQGLTHEKLNNIAAAFRAANAQNQKYHSQSHAKMNAVQSVVDQIAAGQGVEIDWARVEEAAKKGAAEALADGIVKVDVSVQGQGQ